MTTPNFGGGGYNILRPRLTKYCRGCIPGVPGGVDAYARVASLLRAIQQFLC